MTKSIAFSMFGQFRPAKAGSRSSSAKRRRARRRSVSRRLRRQRADRKSFGEILERPVPGLARLARTELPLDGAEDRKAKNPLGVDRIRVAPQRLDPRDAERARALLDRRAGCWRRAWPATFSGLSSARAQARYVRPAPLGLLDRRIAPAAAPMRWRKREATVGSPPRFRARLRIASRAPSAETKSCAVWPIRRSGGESPSVARIGRLRKASVSTAGGQTFSSRPAMSTRSNERSACFEQAQDGETRMTAEAPAARGTPASASSKRRAYSPSVQGKSSPAASRHSSMSTSSAASPCGALRSPSGAASTARARRDARRATGQGAATESARRGPSAAAQSRASASPAARSASGTQWTAGWAWRSSAAIRAAAKAASRSSSAGDRGGAEDAELERAGSGIADRDAARPNRAAGWAISAWIASGRKSRAASRTSRASAPASVCAEGPPGRILDLDAPAGELGRHPARDRRIRGDEGGGLARRLQDFAHRDRQGERLLRLLLGDDHGDALERLRDRGGRERRLAIAPGVGRVGRAQGFADERGARGERPLRGAERDHLLPRHADQPDQPVEQRLRMAGEPLLVAVARRRSSPRRARRDGCRGPAERPRPGRRARWRRSAGRWRGWRRSSPR